MTSATGTPQPSRAGRVLHLDCFSGISGNMFLGSLIGLGVPEKVVQEALAPLGVEGLELKVDTVRRGALAAQYVSFEAPARSSSERRFASIRELLQRAALSESVRSNALRVFGALADAEGRVHGIDPDEVHFHEVGAADAIGDIVGVCVGLEHLNIDRVHASPLALGEGTVDTDHGRLPLPAPATIELLRGIPTVPAHMEWETVTPTGAALISTLAAGFGPMPALTPLAQAFGAGEDRKGDLPNVVRAVLGESSALLEQDLVTVIETNLDDMHPEHLPYLMEELMSDGALDVSTSSLTMKKGRSGQLLRVIARPVDRERLVRRIMQESSALGVRYLEMPRLKQMRDSAQVSTRFGTIAVKRIQTPDGRAVATPEYEACAAAAREHGVPLREVYREVERAAEEQLA